MDNILNRAIFEDFTYQLDTRVKSSHSTKAISPLINGQVFCLKEIGWRYGVDNSYRDNYGWPKFPLRVTLEGVFKDRVESPFKCSPPRILQNIELEAFNPSSIDVSIYYSIKGILVTPRDGEFLSFKEIMGYSLLDDNQKGLLALNEALADRKQLSLDTTWAKINELPGDSNNKNQLKSLASLPDEESLISLMIGDLVSFQDPSIEPLKIEQIRELAKYLIINKHWVR